MLGDVEEEKAKATSLEWRERREDDRKVREMVEKVREMYSRIVARSQRC